MRSFILGAAVCLIGVVAGANSASAQVVTYTTPYGSYSTGYPGSTVVVPRTVHPGYIAGRLPYIAPYVPVTPYYSNYYYYGRPAVQTYYGPVYGWRW